MVLAARSVGTGIRAIQVDIKGRRNKSQTHPNRDHKKFALQILDISFHGSAVRGGLFDGEETRRMRHFRNLGEQEVLGGAHLEEVRLDLVPVFAGVQRHGFGTHCGRPGAQRASAKFLREDPRHEGPAVLQGCDRSERAAQRMSSRAEAKHVLVPQLRLRMS